MQMIAPADMRGRMGALIVMVSNIGGFALGPMMVGALTDYVYGAPEKVGLSVATTLAQIGPLAMGLIWIARRGFVMRVRANEVV